MRRLAPLLAALLASFAPPALAERAPALKEVIAVDEPVVALTHVQIIDGTGAPPRADQTLVIADGKIRAFGDAKRVAAPAGARVLALAGATVMPGLVGMHDHLFMTGTRAFKRPLFTPQGMAFARLYLASGVTTIRTTGTVAPDADLALKRLIDDGQEPGPHVFVTGPYLEGVGNQIMQVRTLRGPDDARATVQYWADAGATSFKVYMHVARAELAAAIEAAHARGLKVTGHLCTIGFHAAIALGIDNVEHGFLYDSDLFPGRTGDTCPDGDAFDKAFAQLAVESPVVKQAFAELIQHHVAVTSTLAVFESVTRPEPAPRVLELLTPSAREELLRTALRLAGMPERRAALGAAVKKDMELERAFVRAGGLLLAGADPTGAGGVLAGIADQRELELLVEAGFTPVEAIHIATQNGAEFLGEGQRAGSIAAGKRADLVVVRGDPAAKIADVEKVELVFKDGVGYDPAKLLESLRGKIGF